MSLLLEVTEVDLELFLVTESEFDVEGTRISGSFDLLLLLLQEVCEGMSGQLAVKKLESSCKMCALLRVSTFPYMGVNAVLVSGD